MCHIVHLKTFPTINMNNLEQISYYTSTFVNIIGGSDDYKGSHPFGISKNMKKINETRQKQKKIEEKGDYKLYNLHHNCFYDFYYLTNHPFSIFCLQTHPLKFLDPCLS